MEYQIIWNYGTKDAEVVDTTESYKDSIYLLHEYQLAFNSYNFKIEEVKVK